VTLPQNPVRPLVAFAFMFGSSVIQAAGPTELSGTWKLDKSRGELPGGPATLDSILTIDVAGNVITVTRTGFIGPVTSTFNRYVLDGQPHSYCSDDTCFSDAPQNVRSTTWLSDANGFEVRNEQSTERWTLSFGGQVLSVETVFYHPCPPCSPPNPRVDHTVYVFVKQP
jgi:hypothetical protein